MIGRSKSAESRMLHSGAKALRELAGERYPERDPGGAP
jgi:hypothetical protein